MVLIYSHFLIILTQNQDPATNGFWPFSFISFSKMMINKKLTLFSILHQVTVLVVTGQVIRQGCPQKCGNVTIPYPFGIGEVCALNKHFVVICNDTNHTNPQPLLTNTSLPILDISLERGQLRKWSSVAKDCYNQKGVLEGSISAESKLYKYYYSPTRNKFTAVGCDTYARLAGSTNEQKYGSGCISVCYNRSTVINGSCSGIGCCQTSIPKQLSMFNATLESYTNHTLVWDFNPCSYAFIADADYFNHFSTSNLLQMPDQVPSVLDWAIGVESCKDATRNLTSYACRHNSHCKDSDNGPGYLCLCNQGYQGNPYHPAGCVDVDECEDPSLNNCSHKCHNVKGHYTCSCPSWFHGDGKKNGQGCTLDYNRIIYIIIGALVLAILLLAGKLLLHTHRRKRKQKELKLHNFKQNGGLLLLDRISQRDDKSINMIKIFKTEEIKEATDNFSEGRICGRGGFGTVYRGHLSDGTIVAIKKSKFVNQNQIEQFINEITVLSQINHRNVVRLLGCCLETEVPLLVYEFITNGTLSDHLHDENKRLKMPWLTRLKIAAETAGVLSYLHSAHSPPIIHRDIKPTNILLDDDYTSKVSDFGASRLIPKNVTEICTMVQGTLGYLDPEYLQTSQLTEKSDVYSFGVVLLELLTGLKANSFEQSVEDLSLVNYFLSLTKEDSIREILDKGMMDEDNIKEMFQVAKTAKMCLRVKGEERPTMKEVAMELEGLLMELKHESATTDSTIEEIDDFLPLEIKFELDP